MRIRVTGELTEDRLKEALALIRAKGPGVTCYFEGYLLIKAGKAAEPSSKNRALNTSDIALDDDAHDDKEDDASESLEEWDGPVPAYVCGVVDNSPEAIERRRNYDLERAESERKNAEWRAEHDQALSQHISDVEIFQRLVLRYGDELISAINAEIAAVWAEVKPVFVHRMKDYELGASRPMPRLQLLGKSVSFFAFNTAGTTKKILTPLSMKDGSLGACPIWKYPEWKDCAVPRIRAVIEQFAQAAGLVRVNVGDNPVSPYSLST